MTSLPPRSPNSFLRAMALIGVAILPILAIGFLRFEKDPGRAGYLVGYFSAPFVISGIAVGIWAVLAKRTWSWVDYSIRFFSIAALVLVLSFAGNVGKAGTELVALTDAEKEHLIIDGTEARHTDFGFVLTLPSASYQPSVELETQTNQSFAEQDLLSNHVWVLHDPAIAGVIMVLVIKGAGNNKAALRGAARGFLRGASKADARVVEDTLIWESETREYRFAAAFPNGAYLRTRCLSSPAVVVCLQTASADSNDLKGVRERLRLAS